MVAAWGQSVPSRQLFLSVISVQELELGILLKERRHPAEGAALRRWLEAQVLPAFAGRVLPVTLEIARCCAALHVPQTRPERDGLIAATALFHRLTLVTRNTKDFEGTAVPLLNPWQAQPPESL